MNPRIKPRASHVVLLVVGVLIGMLTVGTAVAVTSSSFEYSTPKIGTLSLSPSDFVPSGNSATWRISWSPPELNSVDCFETGVNLPNGSRIISIKFFYRSGNTGDFSGRLYRQNLATHFGDPLAFVNPADDSEDLKWVAQAVPATKQTVANGTYAYAVVVCPAPDFDGAFITYKYFSAGD